jgi:hypothetical protein
MAESTWEIAEPQKFSFDEPVSSLHVRIVNGTVNVVGTDEPSARLEVSEIDGPPLRVTQQDGALSVAYDDLPWKGFLNWLDRRGRQRHAVVSLAVPSGTAVEVGTVAATATISGIEGRTGVKGVTGDTTLVGLSGSVRAETVSGGVEVQAVTGDLRFTSVSGDLTVVAAGSSVKADSVSGDMIVDLDPAGGATDVKLTSVSGEIAIRLPHPADAVVEADTTSGAVSNAFEDLRVGGEWGTKRITGRLGAGTGTLRATTVSGAISLLRRPQPDAYETHEHGTAPGTPPTSPTSGDDVPDDAAPGVPGAQTDGDNPPMDTPPTDTPPAGDSTTGKVL